MLFYPSFKDNTFKLVEKKIIFLLLFSIKIVNNYYYPKLYKPLFSSGRLGLGRQVVLDTWLSASRLQLASFLEMSNIWSTLHTPHCLSERGRPRISKQWEICRICSMFLTKTQSKCSRQLGRLVRREGRKGRKLRSN